MAEEKGSDCHSDHVTAGKCAVEKDWQTAWYDGDCKDANRDVSKWLKEHVEKLTGGKARCRVLVPMCGAVRDMHWLLEEGHEVIGMELVDKALHLFLDRHQIEYTASDVPSVNNGRCYKSKDEKLTLYRCNVFEMDMSLVGKVDCVWDCGAMTDIPPAERIKYAETILSALSPGGRILAETFTFGEVKGAEDAHEDDCHEHAHTHGHDHQSGDEHKDEFHDAEFPCRPVEAEDFEKMYGARCNIELVSEEDNPEAEEWGPGWWGKNRLHLIILK